MHCPVKQVDTRNSLAHPLVVLSQAGIYLQIPEISQERLAGPSTYIAFTRQERTSPPVH